MIALQIFATLLIVCVVVGVFTLSVWSGFEKSREEVPNGIKMTFGACFMFGLAMLAGVLISMVWIFA